MNADIERGEAREFRCADCGSRVFCFVVPDTHRCLSCDWIRQHVAPADQADVRERLGVPLVQPTEAS